MGIVARLQSCEGALLKALPILRWAAMFVSNSRAQFHMIAGDMDAAEQQLISSARDLLADPEALDGMRSQYLIFVKNMAFLLFSCVRLHSYRLFKLVERLVATSGLASSRLSFSSPLPPSRPPLSLILLPIPPPLLSRTPPPLLSQNPPPLLSQNPPSLSTSRCRHPSLDPCPCLHLVPVPRHHCRVSLPPFPPWLRPPPVLMLSSLGTLTKEPSSTPLPLLFLPSSISSPLKPSWRRK